MADINDKPGNPAMTQIPNHAGYTQADQREYYKLYRDRITSEDTLVSNRLTWLLIPQAVLYGFSAASVASKEGFSIVCLALVAALGSSICWVGRRSICAALTTIEQIRKQYADNFKPTDPKLPPLTAEDAVHARGRMAARWVPLCIIAGWFLLFLYGVLILVLKPK